ncbi:MAG: two-component regulator propeller domain-containing protein, partial [Candidatus Cryptobacteroides sp.]
MKGSIAKRIAVLAAVVAVGTVVLPSADAAGLYNGGGNSNSIFSFINLSVNDGLSQCTVLSCTQDTLGRMWFATQDGLNLYDGYEFRTFRNIPADTTSISSNIIRKLCIDKSGNLWVGTGKGLSWYDANRECFRNFPTEDRMVTGIADAGDGRLMVAAGGDLLFFDKTSMRFEQGNVLHYSGNIRATELLGDNDLVWIGTASDGVLCWSPDNNGVRKIFSPQGGKQVQCILRKDNELWIATEGDGLWVYDLKSNSSTGYRYSASLDGSISSNYVRSLAEDTYGRIWVGTYNGLSIFDGGKFHNVRSDPFLEGSLSQSSVRCILRDNQGGMWLGTYFGGINYWHPRMNRFHVIKREPTANSLNDNVVSCISEDSDGLVWIGTNSGGVNCYDPATGRFSAYKLRDNGRQKLESDDIKAIFVDDRSGTIYVGAHAGGLSRVDRRQGRLHPYESGTDDPLDVYALAAAPGGCLWVGTLSGLKSFNPVSGRFISHTTDAEGNPISDWSVRTLANDTEGRLWVGREHGLNVFDTKGGKLSPVNLFQDCPELGTAFVQCICQTSSKLVWIGTRSGLFCWRPEKNEFVRFTSADGLPSDIVSGMEEDRFGRLWISTDRGLCCFNPLSGHFRNYTLEDGLPGNQFNPGAHLSMKNG